MAFAAGMYVFPAHGRPARRARQRGRVGPPRTVGSRWPVVDRPGRWSAPPSVRCSRVRESGCRSGRVHSGRPTCRDDWERPPGPANARSAWPPAGGQGPARTVGPVRPWARWLTRSSTPPGTTPSSFPARLRPSSAPGRRGESVMRSGPAAQLSGWRCCADRVHAAPAGGYDSIDDLLAATGSRGPDQAGRPYVEFDEEGPGWSSVVTKSRTFGPPDVADGTTVNSRWR